MDKFDAQVLFEIALGLDLPDILSFCSTNQKINRLVCQNDHFWRRKIKEEFPEYLNLEKERGLREQYKLLYGLRDLKEKLELEENLRELYDLEYLDLRNNKLTSLPESIGNLSNLRWLYLSDNSLTSLPESIGNLSKLESLNFNNDEL